MNTTQIGTTEYMMWSVIQANLRETQDTRREGLGLDLHVVLLGVSLRRLDKGARRAELEKIIALDPSKVAVEVAHLAAVAILEMEIKLLESDKELSRVMDIATMAADAL